MIAEHLALADQVFSKSRLGFTPLTPTNLETIRRRFHSRPHNPRFSYAPISVSGKAKALRELEFEKGPLDRFYERKRHQLLCHSSMLARIGTEGFTHHSCRLFAPPNSKLVSRAYALLDLPYDRRDSPLAEHSAMSRLQAVLDKTGLGWTAASAPIITNARVSHSKKQVQLRSGAKLTARMVRRLIIHEIGTHVLRTENGALQPYGIFKLGFADYQKTEEGLAAYNEYRHGLMTKEILRNYAGRVIAIDQAMENSFLRTYRHLNRFFDEETSFQLTLRAKRGLSDTSQPGAFTKDSIYLDGFLLLKQAAKRRSLDPLYLGKVGLFDLDAARRLPGIKKPHHQLSLVSEHIEQGKALDPKEVDRLLEMRDLQGYVGGL